MFLTRLPTLSVCLIFASYSVARRARQVQARAPLLRPRGLEVEWGAGVHLGALPRASCGQLAGATDVAVHVHHFSILCLFIMALHAPTGTARSETCTPV